MFQVSTQKYFRVGLTIYVDAKVVDIDIAGGRVIVEGAALSSDVLDAIRSTGTAESFYLPPNPRARALRSLHSCLT